MRRRLGCPEPDFEVNGFFTVTFWPSPGTQEETDGNSAKQVTMDVTEETMDVSPQEPTRTTKDIRVLQAVAGEATRQELQKALGLKNDDHFRKNHLSPAIQEGLIEMTVPDETRSRNQHYRVAPKGREVVDKFKKGE